MSSIRQQVHARQECTCVSACVCVHAMILYLQNNRARVCELLAGGHTSLWVNLSPGLLNTAKNVHLTLSSAETHNPALL